MDAPTTNIVKLNRDKPNRESNAKLIIDDDDDDDFESSSTPEPRKPPVMMGGGFGMSMAALSSVNLRKTTPGKAPGPSPAAAPAAAPRPMGMGMGLGPGFNPAAIKLKKTAAGPGPAAKPKAEAEEEKKPVDFRANLRKTKAQGFCPPPLSGDQVANFRAGLRKTAQSGPKKEDSGDGKKSENGQFDFRANLKKTGLLKTEEKAPEQQQQQ